MALTIPDAGASRGTLIDSLEQLRKQYAGNAKTTPGVKNGGRVLSDEEITNWLAQNPHLAPSNVPGAVLGAAPGPMAAGWGAVPAVPAQGGGIAADGYGAAGWGANGVNLFNPNLARGDMAAPGPVGRGPGFWTLDNYGTPFWRSDWEQRNGQWFIKGEQ
jgi:hypothetical protein